jgi:hypothetical protein
MSQCKESQKVIVIFLKLSLLLLLTIVNTRPGHRTGKDPSYHINLYCQFLHENGSPPPPPNGMFICYMLYVKTEYFSKSLVLVMETQLDFNL